MRRMLDVDIPGKRRRVESYLRWKDACTRDRIGHWVKKLITIAIPTTPHGGQARDEEEEVRNRLISE